MTDVVLGIITKPKENYLFASHIFFSRVKSEFKESDFPNFEDEETITVLPGVSMGLDVQALSWLNVRFGVVSLVRGKTKVEFGTETTETKFTPFDWAIGAGVKLGDLMIDLGMDREFIQRGPNVLSGENGEIFPKATVSYNFGGQSE